MRLISSVNTSSLLKKSIEKEKELIYELFPNAKHLLINWKDAYYIEIVKNTIVKCHFINTSFFVYIYYNMTLVTTVWRHIPVKASELEDQTFYSFATATTQYGVVEELELLQWFRSSFKTNSETNASKFLESNITYVRITQWGHAHMTV